MGLFGLFSNPTKSFGITKQTNLIEDEHSRIMGQLGTGYAGARAGLEGLYHQRAGTAASQYAAVAGNVGGQYASQGLNPMLGSRILGENRAGILGSLGVARGEMVSDQGKLDWAFGQSKADAEKLRGEQLLNAYMARSSVASQPSGFESFLTSTAAAAAGAMGKKAA